MTQRTNNKYNNKILT